MNDQTALEPAAEKPVTKIAAEGRPPRKDDIGAVTTRFLEEIDSLSATLPLAVQSVTESLGTAAKKMKMFLEERGHQSGDERTSVKLTANDFPEIERLMRLVKRSGSALVLVPRSFFVTLVSQYDAFLAGLIEALLLIKPEILNNSERALPYSDLVNFDSIEDARNHVLEKEVESVLRKSHPEQFEWMEKKFNIKLRDGLSAWPLFVELTERRNLFVHTGGQTSSQYLHTCKAHGVVHEKPIVRGDVLSIDQEYFRKAYEVVLEIGVKLAHVLWRKLRPDDLEAADRHMAGVTFNLLLDENYELVKKLLDFRTEILKKNASAEWRLIFVVNRVQAYKWSGDEKRALEILDQEDFSALSPRFKLAEAALRDNPKRAAELVRQMGSKGEMSLIQYREWPLFQRLRSQREFEEAILEVFNEPVNKLVLPTSSTETPVVLEDGSLAER